MRSECVLRLQPSIGIVNCHSNDRNNARNADVMVFASAAARRGARVTHVIRKQRSFSISPTEAVAVKSLTKSGALHFMMSAEVELQSSEKQKD